MHKLEQEILRTLSGTKLTIADTDKIRKNLEEMKTKGIYLMSKGEIHDGLLRFQMTPLIRDLNLDNFNHKIDRKKRKLGSVADLPFQLTEAILKNASVEDVRSLLDQGANCNQLGTSGRLPLHLAVEKNRPDLMALLHSFGANFATPDSNNSVVHIAYHKARQTGSFDVLQLLIRTYQCDIETQNADGLSILDGAIIDGDEIGCMQILELGADPEGKRSRHQTPLELATKGNTKTFDPLDSFFTPDSEKRQIRDARSKITVVLQRAIQEKTRIARVVAAINSSTDGEVHLVSQNITGNDLNLLIEGLKSIPFLKTISLRQNPLLTHSHLERLVAFLEKHTYVTKLILDGCNITPEEIENLQESLLPNKRLEKLLGSYNRTEHLDLVTMLIEQKANFSDIHADGWYLWHCAVSYEHARTISLLLEHEIPISKAIEGEDGRHCLHLAIENKDIPLMKILLDADVFYVNKTDTNQRNCISMALEKGFFDGIKLLLQRRADPNTIMPTTKMSLLDYTVENIRPQELALLMDFNVQVNAYQILGKHVVENKEIKQIIEQHRQKEKEFCLAARDGCLEKLEQLAREGVDFNAPNEQNKSAFELALECEHWKVAAWLLQREPKFIDGIVKLTEAQKDLLKEEVITYQNSDPEATIYFLRSRTRYYASAHSPRNKVIDIYKDLYGKDGDEFAQYIRPLLKVLETNFKLEIIFDASASDIRRIHLTSEPGTHGAFLFYQDKLYIAGLPEESYERVRGIVAHEICHGVCHMIWNNQCKSFNEQDSESKDQFEKIFDVVQQSNLSKLNKIISEVFRYPEHERFRELIVRPAQILAQHGLECIRKLCAESNEFEQLWNYYTEVVLHAAATYIEQVHTVKTKDKRAVLAAHSLEMLCPVNIFDKKPDLVADAGVKLERFFRAYLVRQTILNLRMMNQYTKVLLASLRAFNVTVDNITRVENELNKKYVDTVNDLANPNRLFNAYSGSQKIIKACNVASAINLDSRLSF